MAKTRLRKGAAITAVVVAFVGGFEGLRTVAYRDPVGIPTVCFGETKGVKMGDRYTVAECKAMLTESLISHEAGMRKCMRNPDAVPDGAYGAFLSFTYNVGVGAFCKSTLNKRLNAGDIRGACGELTKWNRAGGIVLPGLTRRRAAERDMCLGSL